MSTPAVSSHASHASKAPAACNKAPGHDNKAANGSASSAQAPKGDLFSLLLMMAGTGADGTPDGGIELTDTETDTDPNADPSAWMTPALDTASGQTDPVQAMLQSRYPLERANARLEAGGLPPQPPASGAAARDGGVDIRALGMEPVVEDPTLSGELNLPSPEAANTNAAPARPAMVAWNRTNAPMGSPAALARPGMGAVTSTAHLQAAGASKLITDAAQAAVTLSHRGADTPTWGAGLMMRSTVALDSRSPSVDMGALSAGASPLVDAALAGQAAGGHQSGSGSPGGHSPQASVSDTGAADNTPVTDDTPWADSATEAAHAAEETLSEHWSASQLQQARLSIGDEDGSTIDVQLKLAGQTVNVEFRTDDEHARNGLHRDGGQDLADRLAQEGLALADVSVGGRQASGGQQGQPGTPGAATLERRQGGGRAAAGNDATPVTAAPLRPRTDGSRPLDMFV